MNNFTYAELAALRRQGIIVLIEYRNGPIKCTTSQGARYYTADDLRQIAKPGFLESMRHWLMEVAA